MRSAVQTACNRKHMLTSDVGIISTAFQVIVSMNEREIGMNRDQMKGRIKEAEGDLREVTGNSIRSHSPAQKAKLRDIVGKIQAGYGGLKDDLEKVNELALTGDVYEL